MNGRQAPQAAGRFACVASPSAQDRISHRTARRTTPGAAVDDHDSKDEADERHLDAFVEIREVEAGTEHQPADDRHGSEPTAPSGSASGAGRAGLGATSAIASAA